MIEPKILKGFRDSLPRQEIARRRLTGKVERIFRLFGFVPIDTPAIEYAEVLLGKGGGETDKQMYRFRDNGERDVALRFDLTVPLARYVAANQQSLCFPFKRYHIAKVWRGEKPQKGRFREFYQCDFDIIGSDNAASDAEILILIHTCLTEMGIGSFRVRVSHRGILSALLESLGIAEKNADVLRIIDKLGKIGSSGVEEALIEAGISSAAAHNIMAFVSSDNGTFPNAISMLREKFGDADFICRLEEIHSILESVGIADEFILDMSITRGLDYYTGLVFETSFLDYPSVGSICSGGRYNNLTGLYTRDSLPGVGSCIGLDRLLAALEEIKSPVTNNTSAADVMVARTESLAPIAEKTALTLRRLGIKTDMYVADRNMGRQYAYAESNGIKYVITSYVDGKYQIKNTETRESSEYTDLAEFAAAATLGAATGQTERQQTDKR